MDTIWTADRVERLKKLRADGWSSAQIADDLGLSRNAAIGKIYRLKLPLPTSRSPLAPQRRRGPGSFTSLPRRNPSRNIMAKIAIAAAEPGLPEHLKGEMPDGSGVKLGELTELTCHWPIGDPKTPEFEFCGARSIPGLPYCAGHCRLAYGPTESLNRADKALST
jgi:GcrA cell cycle regulator